MVNKLYILIIFLILFFIKNTLATEEFVFDVTEIEITEQGNLIKGINKGTIKTNNGVLIKSDYFSYDKIDNVLISKGDVEIFDTSKNTKLFGNTIIYNKKLEIFSASGNVQFLDQANDVQIFTENAKYKKVNQIIETKENSKAIYANDKIITADEFSHDIKNNILEASGNVKAQDKLKKTTIFSEKITYYKTFNKIITKGKTNLELKSKYEAESKDLVYLLDKNYLSSNYKTKIIHNKTDIYYFDKFAFLINEEILKGENVLIISNYNSAKSDKIYFSNASIDLKKKKFIGKDVNLKIHKNIFDDPENDPRLKGVSAKGSDELTIVNKGIFTSCKETDSCPPWSIKADKITHDKKKKQITYDNAILNFYKIPVLYFPKFFHPDPTVKRQTGFLKPRLNNSNTLGSSFSLPYFKEISKNKDFTISPTIFDEDMLMSQMEYRQIEEHSSFIADVGFVKDYYSKSEKNKKDFFHFFAKYNLDLNFENFDSSNLNISTERITNDTYLKLFSPLFIDNSLNPSLSTLENKIKLNLIHEDYDLETGIETYETLNSTTSDRYQYVLPYYDFDRFIDQNYFDGTVTLTSSGANDLNQTNRLETTMINGLKYNSNSLIWGNGIKNNFSVNFKNVNSVGKKSSKYDSSPNVELISLFNTNFSLPLVKEYDEYTSLLTPKISFRINPTKMNNHSSSDNKIDISNLFSDNRLGLSDTYEAGRSMTIGFDFLKSKNNLDEINKYFEMKLGTVLRDKKENSIPKNSTLDEKHSNIFGSIKSQLNDKVQLGYNFSIDNDYSTFEYNDINATLSLNNLVTTFNFIEENNEIGDTNVVSNSIKYKYNDSNFFTFKTRRNRKINLTEYYDLVYEYKNDCLTAGIKYNKTYYSDSDLKPSENLFFTITFVPLTTYEYKDDQLLNN